MSHNKRKCFLDSENRTSKDVRAEIERRQNYQRDLSNQVAERQLLEREEKEKEEKLKQQFQEMQVTMQNHIKKHQEKAKSIQTKKETFADVLNSKANCINTDLSKNYVLKHREAKDYNTLTDTSGLKPDLIRNDSGKHQRLKQLRSRLQEAKQKAFEALDNKEKSEARLFELKAQLKQMKQDKEGYMAKLKSALSQNKADDTSNAFLCETDFIPVNNNDNAEITRVSRQPRHSVENKPGYRIHSGVRRWSSRQPNDKCEKEIKDLQGLIDNYYKK